MALEVVTLPYQGYSVKLLDTYASVICKVSPKY